jgi:threonine dehydrogenase-like Zn-dependent dehydrogenase
MTIFILVQISIPLDISKVYIDLGDRVAIDNTELCGHCFYCRRNQPLYCENFGSHGCNMAGGLAKDEVVTQTFPISNYSEALAALRSRQGIKNAVMP